MLKKTLFYNMTTKRTAGEVNGAVERESRSPTGTKGIQMLCCWEERPGEAEICQINRFVLSPIKQCDHTDRD